jgi:hypothetical protein
MRVSLQDRLEELNRLLGVSRGVASTLEMKEAFQPVLDAALVNSMMVQALDFDDVHEDAVLHPSCVQVPVAFAVAEQIPGVRGRDLIAAIALAPISPASWLRPIFRIGFRPIGNCGYSVPQCGKLSVSREEMIRPWHCFRKRRKHAGGGG